MDKFHVTHHTIETKFINQVSMKILMLLLFFIKIYILRIKLDIAIIKILRMTMTIRFMGYFFSGYELSNPKDASAYPPNGLKTWRVMLSSDQ